MTFHRRLAKRAPSWMNGIALRRAGRGSLAALEHRGRVSGTVRRNPVRAFRRGDTVIVGLNFGPETDWLKNIRAAGGCRMRLGDEILVLGAPRVVPVEEASAEMPRWFALALRYVVRTKNCVVLPVVTSAAPHDAPDLKT
jgi:deazaflavin-dependent oxidoreductase (nitroreductase family)